MKLFGNFRDWLTPPEERDTFAALVEAMKAKDPEFFEAEIGPRSSREGRKKWREKYPDDLVSDLVREWNIEPKR